MTDWTVQNAKSHLSEILRRARAGELQRIGEKEPCVVVSEKAWAALQGGKHLGRWLVENAPRGEPLELPSRKTRRGDPFADDDRQ